MNFRNVCSIAVCMALCSCVSAQQNRMEVRDDTVNNMSIAQVQREIKVGMYSADVVAILGAPNMVTTDSERRETWVYDKVATEQVYSTSGGGAGGAVGGGVFGSLAGAIAGIGGNYQKNTGAASTSQRTLTIIIKFDNDSRVRDFSYRQSSF